MKHVQTVAKGSKEQEAAINSLVVDGYRGWSDHYDTIVGKLRMHITTDGEEKSVSAGQALNLLNHPDRAVRQVVFKEYTRVWQEESRLFSDTLNHLSGFRLTTYDIRKWDNILEEPLAINRLDEQTLKSMWNVIQTNKPTFVRFLDRKAKLLGLEKLSFYDVEAPLVFSSEPKNILIKKAQILSSNNLINSARKWQTSRNPLSKKVGLKQKIVIINVLVAFARISRSKKAGFS